MKDKSIQAESRNCANRSWIEPCNVGIIYNHVLHNVNHI